MTMVYSSFRPLLRVLMVLALLKGMIHNEFKTATRRGVPPYFPWLSLLPVRRIFINHQRGSRDRSGDLLHPEMNLGDIFFRNFDSKPPRDRWEPFNTSDEAREALSKMTSWDENALEGIRHSLSHLMKDRPVEVYAIALDLLRAPGNPLPRDIARGVEDMARSAARNSLLDPPLGTWTTGMDIKRDDYNRFTTYHFRCTVRLLVFLSTGELVKKTGTDWVWFNTRCGVCPLTSRSIVVPAEVLGTKYTAMWWVEYWERIVGAVGDSPCEKPFDDEPIWNSTLQALARGCPACHETAAKEFPLFRERLVNMVTKIIEDVRLEIKL